MFTSAYIPNTKQIEDFFSVNRDFPIRTEGADSSYVLCSSPRSGSTLVSSMLYATGLAGDPLEYLNDQWIKVHVQANAGQMADFDVDNYLAEWESRRTSPNGIFGIKLHYHQMRRVWRGREKEAAERLGAYGHRILLVRRDKVAQAVSLYRAITSQVWVSQGHLHPGQDNPNKNRTPEFNAVRIAELMTFLIKEEEGWRNFMQTNNLPFLELCYEDFLADYPGTSVKLLKYLGMDFDADAIPPPQLARQGKDNDPLVEQFKRLIGFLPLPAGETMGQA